jgi:predicted transcriptional regulator
MPRKLKLRVASAGEALDAFEVAWNSAREGGRPLQEHVLGFPDLPRLLATLTPARWALLRRLRESGPSSVNALAKLLGRDYKNVHTDVRALLDLGLVGRREDGLVEVVWDRVNAELRF